MIDELEPVWSQFTETYEALRQALAEVPEDRLHWKPGPRANSVAEIVQHIDRANVGYASRIDDHPYNRGAAEEAPTRKRLLAWLEESERRVRAVIEQLSAEDLRRARAERWSPVGPEVQGPLEALWFTQQMVRHTAYHLGQINYILTLLEGEGG